MEFLFRKKKDTTLVCLRKKIEETTTGSLEVEALLSLSVCQLRRDFNTVETYMNETLTILEKPALFYDARHQRAEIFSN